MAYGLNCFAFLNGLTGIGEWNDLVTLRLEIAFVKGDDLQVIIHGQDHLAFIRRRIFRFDMEDRQGEIKSAAFSGHALDADPSAVHLDNCWLMDSPSPLPPVLRVRESSTCEKAWKSFV